MKKIVCSVCGGSKIIKQGSLYVCQDCGIFYNEEDIKNMIQDDIESPEESNAPKVEVNRDEIKNKYYLDISYTLAKRASDDEQHSLAMKYYEQLSSKYQFHWEPHFMKAYHKVKLCKVSEMKEGINSLKDATLKSIDLIEQYEENESEKYQVLNSIMDKCLTISDICFKEIMKGYDSFRLEPSTEITTNMESSAYSCIQLLYEVADTVNEKYGAHTTFLEETIKKLWNLGVDNHQIMVKYLPNSNKHQNIINEYLKKTGRILTELKKETPNQRKVVEEVSEMSTRYEKDPLYALALEATDGGNYEKAIKYYEQLVVRYPQYWQPHFMLAYNKAIFCKIVEIGKRAQTLEQVTKEAFKLVEKHITSKKEKIIAIQYMAGYC